MWTLLGLWGAADVRNPGGNLTWTSVNIVGFQSGLPNGLVVKYSLTPENKYKNKWNLLPYNLCTDYLWFSWEHKICSLDCCMTNVLLAWLMPHASLVSKIWLSNHYLLRNHFIKYIYKYLQGLPCWRWFNIKGFIFETYIVKNRGQDGGH